MDNLPKEQSASSPVTSNVVNTPKPPHKNIRNQVVAILLIVTLGVVAAFGTFFVMNQMDSAGDLSEIDETRAWQFSSSAESYCDSSGVKIKVTFRNTEPQGAQNAMAVTAKDNQSGKEVDLGNVASGASVEGYIDPESASINAGTVTIRMAWADGRNGVDTRNINYSAQSCQVTASSSPSSSPTASSSASPSAAASASPSSSPITYQEPAYLACPAGQERYTFSGELLNQSGKNTKTHTLNITRSGTLSSIRGVRKEGHPESGCQAGPGNDNGRSNCDQNQNNESFKLFVNDAEIGNVEDKGQSFDDAWAEFTINGPVNLTQGNNSIKLTHNGGTGPGSVDYKVSICYTLNSASSSPSASPSAAASVSASASPSVAASPSPSTISQASIPPAPTGDGQSDNQGCSVNDCSGNKVADNKAVANAGTTNSTGSKGGNTLPDAGVPVGPYLAIGGIMFLASGLILGKRKKY